MHFADGGLIVLRSRVVLTPRWSFL